MYLSRHKSWQLSHRCEAFLRLFVIVSSCEWAAELQAHRLVGWLTLELFFTDYSMFILLSLPKQSERGLLNAENFAKFMTFLRQTVNSWYTWLGWVRSNCLRLGKMMESSSLRWDVTTWVENSDRLLAASSSFSCVVRPLSGFDVILEPCHPVLTRNRLIYCELNLQLIFWMLLLSLVMKVFSNYLSKLVFFVDGLEISIVVFVYWSLVTIHFFYFKIVCS